MQENKKIGELMIPISEYPTVLESDTLNDAIAVLRNYASMGKDYRSLAVFSKSKKITDEPRLAGILTVRDILRAIEKNIEVYDNRGLSPTSWIFFYKKQTAEEYLEKKINRVLRPLVKSFVQTHEDVSAAINLIISKNVNLLPVFEGTKVAGVVRAIDLLFYIAENKMLMFHFKTE